MSTKKVRNVSDERASRVIPLLGLVILLLDVSKKIFKTKRVVPFKKEAKQPLLIFPQKIVMKCFKEKVGVSLLSSTA